MLSRFSLWLGLVLALAVLTLAGPLAAGSNDKEVEELVNTTLQSEYTSSNFDSALEQLNLAKQACEGNTCSAKVRAKVHIAIGTVLAAGKKKTAEAKEAFVLALKEDPTATLFGDFITPEVQKAWNDARAVANASAGGGTPKPQSGGTAATGPKPRKPYPGDVRPGRGFKTGEGYFYYQEAVESERQRDWSDCAAYAQASLAAENRVPTRYLAASCEERAGLWIEAQADYRIVAETGVRAGQYDAAKQAKEKAAELASKIPKVVIRKPAKVTGLVVKMNNAEIDPDQIGGEIWVNPGQRTITARGRIDGVDGEFEQVIDVSEYESVTVDIKLLPPGTRVKDATVLKCMAEAKTPDDLARCVRGSSSESSLNYGVGFEFSAYHGSDYVDVVTPALLLSVQSPTSGWGVTGSFLVDVVTAASPDIIATASPRWTEVRYVPALSGHKKFGDVDVSLHGSGSVEPDYLALGGGAGVSFDLRQKTITPSITYDFGYDISGRAGTSFNVFGRQIFRHAVDASVTFVMDKATFFTPSFAFVYESGDSSKPYRYIPMFAPEIAAQVPAGLTPEATNLFRLPERPLEQLPTSRQRYALAGRIAHRFSSSTLRLEERVYLDSWGLKATTTDMRFIADVTREIRAWPHLRFHGQTGVDFWKLAYAGAYENGVLVPPYYRTGDRELGPMVALTLGGGGRIAFGKEKNWGISVSFDVVYTRFLEHLFLLQRFGYFGAMTLETELD